MEKRSGINRNIVECKVNSLFGGITAPCGINRNIVECKAGCLQVFVESLERY